MNLIFTSLKTFASQYLENSKIYKTASKENPSWDLLVNQLPSLFKQKLYLSDRYKIEGSIGAGNLSECPWICFFDTDITTSATKGYYLVLLFRSDMKGFYISLNQGWTQYKDQYGLKNGRVKILENAKKATEILRSLSEQFITGKIDLNAQHDLSKGYELANICAVYYDLKDAHTDQKLLNDLNNLIGIYRELKGLVGTNILDIQSIASEEDYQKEVQNVSPVNLKDGPIEKSETQSSSTQTKRQKRSAGIAKNALISSKYECFFDASHQTFTSSAANQPYVEAHHIIPMQQQDHYKYSLDVPENIIALCPNCHSKIHLAIFSEKEPMLEQLFNVRTAGLKIRGLDLTLNQLKAFYK